MLGRGLREPPGDEYGEQVRHVGDPGDRDVVLVGRHLERGGAAHVGQGGHGVDGFRAGA